MRNFIFTVSYDGTRYNGWQKQGNTPNTIQEKLETLLSRLLEQEVELSGSGRTDAGVHALKQTCSFHADTTKDCAEFLAEIRRFLPEDIGALSLEDAPGRFHARLNCKEKTYKYRIWNSELPNIFQRRYMLTYPSALDVGSMKKAAALLRGQHDFTSFCSNKRLKKSAVREIKSIGLERLGDELCITVTADGFLYNMVRILVGTLLEVGTGQRDAMSVPAVLSALDRSAAGPTAPAHGLILWEQKY